MQRGSVCHVDVPITGERADDGSAESVLHREGHHHGPDLPARDLAGAMTAATKPGTTATADPHALGGDGSLSFRAVYDSEFPVVVRVLRRLGVAERQLEDAAQEVFAVVLRRRAAFDSSKPVRPWLCGIATRVAADFRKRASARYELSMDELEAGATDPGARAVDARQLLLRALACLSDDERAAVLLVDLEGHLAVDIAAALEIPPGTLYSRLHEGRRKLAAAVTQLTGQTR